MSISIQQISYIHPDKEVLFSDLNFAISKGQKLGLVGNNGCGKSTLLQIIAGQLSPSSGVIVRPDDLYYIPQHFGQYDSLTIAQALQIERKQQALHAILTGDVSNENFTILNDDWNIEERSIAALDLWGLGQFTLSYPMNLLSGGEKTRVFLAGMDIHHPSVILMDEPTNHLDSSGRQRLYDWVEKYRSTLLVVSHDRHFLDSVCTHTVDIDFGKVNMFAGNYSFWYESSQLALRQQQNQKAKAEEKKKELEEFIRRFSANVAKSKQTTSRKKMLEKLNVDEIKPSSRKYPGIIFTPDREPGNQILEVSGLRAETEDGMVLFNDVNFNVEKGDKIVFLSRDPRAMTAFFEIINGNRTPQAGKFAWGVTITTAYLPLDNTDFFESDLNLVDWLSQFGEGNEVYMKGFLGRMLFSGEEVLKKVNVLSGGEKMRCMIARMQLRNANCLILDTPTNHLDLESIQAFNNNLKTYKGNVLFSSHDHEFIETVANRIIELTPNGIIDKMMEYDEYITSDHIKEMRARMYGDN